MTVQTWVLDVQLCEVHKLSSVGRHVGKLQMFQVFLSQVPSFDYDIMSSLPVSVRQTGCDT